MFVLKLSRANDAVRCVSFFFFFAAPFLPVSFPSTCQEHHFLTIKTCFPFYGRRGTSCSSSSSSSSSYKMLRMRDCNFFLYFVHFISLALREREMYLLLLNAIYLGHSS